MKDHHLNIILKFGLHCLSPVEVTSKNVSKMTHRQLYDIYCGLTHFPVIMVIHDYSDHNLHNRGIRQVQHPHPPPEFCQIFSDFGTIRSIDICNEGMVILAYHLNLVLEK